MGNLLRLLDLLLSAHIFGNKLQVHILNHSLNALTDIVLQEILNLGLGSWMLQSDELLSEFYPCFDWSLSYQHHKDYCQFFDHLAVYSLFVLDLPRVVIDEICLFGEDSFQSLYF